MTELKGKLIAIGGNEDKGTEPEPNFHQKNNLNFFELQILSRIVQECRRQKDAHIEVITSASSIPMEVGDNYMEAFGKLGCTNIHMMHIRDRSDAQNPEYLDRIRNCDGVMLTGGNQLRLSTIFGGTDILSTLHQRLRNEDFVIAGTSAGAMAMSNTMIYQGSSAGALVKGEVKITTGLAFIKDVIIDSHFDKRGRFGRLAQAVASNPSCIGIGLGEDTGVLIRNNNEMEAIGSGLVVIVDGHGIRYSNIADLSEGSPISIENMIVHVMTKGNGYRLNERKFIVDESLVER
jgi:cyanophycinase